MGRMKRSSFSLKCNALECMVWLLAAQYMVGVECARSASGNSECLLNSGDLQITLGSEGRVVQQVTVNSDVQITCPFPKLEWYRDKTMLTTSRTLKLKGVQEADAGVYGCLAQGNESRADAKWANLTLEVCDIDIKLQTDDFKGDRNLKLPQLGEHMWPERKTNAIHEAHLPKFRSPQLSRQIQKSAGSSVQFSCPAHGSPVANISWSVNNTDIDSDLPRYKLKRWSLFISDLTKRDSGLYSCEVCNEFGCIRHITNLTVIDHERLKPYTESDRPYHQPVVVNSNAVLECRVASDSERDIVWVKHRENVNFSDNALNLANNPDIVRLPTNADSPHELYLRSVRLDDEGWYSCLAANQSGRAVYTTYLKVLRIDDNSIRSDVRNTTSSEYTPPPTALEPNTPYLNTLNLELDNDDALDHDHSDVEYDNKTVSKEEGAPTFKNTNKLVKTVHKPSGSSVQLVCAAIGNPTPNITWTRNNTAIERHIGKVTYKKWSIQMDDIITEDSGVYKCTVCNVHGCIEHSTKITITDRLRSRPIISDKFPQNQTVLTNSSTYLECRVVSDLEPYIVWLRYTRKNESIGELEKTVPNFSNNISMTSKDVIIMERDPDKPNILNLTRVTHKDEGWYTCVAASSLGQTVASAYLKVVDKLPQREVYSLLRSHPVWITSVSIVVVLLFLLGTIFIIYVLRKLKHEKLLKQRIETVHQWTKKVIIYKPASSEGSSCDLQMPVIKIEKQRTTFQTSSNSDPAHGFNEYEFPLDSNWEIPRSQLSLGATLGEGAFGRVVMAQASGLPRMAANGSVPTIVAVKMVKDEHTDADMASLVREMEVMKMIGKHINIINLLGCCSQNGPLWVIVEFAPHGNLKDFLKKNRPLSGWGSPKSQRNSDYLENKPQLTEKHLISFAFQIARGMEYLASRRCIHRDLAARNVLVSDDYVMKIADFGLARDIQDTDYYRKNTNGRLPIKWMAPESLQEKFYDSQSDVWSYGVLLWEIMTYGEQPYPNIMSAEELYSYLITGQRMEKPPRCSLNIYMLMRQCWHFDSGARPTFVEIVENLDKILQLANSTTNEDYLDLSIPMLETPPSSSDEESEPETFRETSPLRYQYTYKFN